MKRAIPIMLITIFFLGTSCKNSSSNSEKSISQNSNISSQNSHDSQNNQNNKGPVLMTADVTFVNEDEKTVDYQGTHRYNLLKEIDKTVANLESGSNHQVLTVMTKMDPYLLRIKLIVIDNTIQITEGSYQSSSSNDDYSLRMLLSDDSNDFLQYWNSKLGAYNRSQMSYETIKNGTFTITKLTKTHIEGTFSFDGYDEVRRNGKRGYHKATVRNGAFEGEIIRE